jgi:hypothetical protein
MERSIVVNRLINRNGAIRRTEEYTRGSPKSSVLLWTRLRKDLPPIDGCIQPVCDLWAELGKRISQGRKFEIEKAWLGTWFRRVEFYIRYHRARTMWSTLRRLEPILKKHFKNHGENDKSDWIAGVTVKLRALPGLEDLEFLIRWLDNKFLLRLRFFRWREQECRANWRALATVLVFKKTAKPGAGESPCEICRFLLKTT